MDRRKFLKNGLLGAAGAGALSALPGKLTAQSKASTAGFVTRPLGKTGVKLPVVSMGVMNSNNENLILAALDGGILHLDTAHGYQRGTNEVAIGKVLQGRPRDSYFIATKVPGDPRDNRTGNFSAETTGRDRSSRSSTSACSGSAWIYVDILYLHNVQTKEAVLFEPLMTASGTDQEKRQGPLHRGHDPHQRT